MKNILLTLMCAGILCMMTACGTKEEERLTPPEPLPEAETTAFNETEADGEEAAGAETETVPEAETVTEESVADKEPESEADTEAEPEAEAFAKAEAADASGQDGSWANGVWKPNDEDEMYVFTPQGQGTMLREMDTAWYDEYMQFENGEILLTEKSISAYGELTEITRDEDIGNFRIYSYVALLEDGLEGMPVRYVLDKDGKLYVLYSDMVRFMYEATSDSLTLILAEEDNETSMVEVVDSEHVNLIYDEDTVSFLRIPHLDAVINYLD